MQIRNILAFDKWRIFICCRQCTLFLQHVRRDQKRYPLRAWYRCQEPQLSWMSSHQMYMAAQRVHAALETREQHVAVAVGRMIPLVLALAECWRCWGRSRCTPRCCVAFASFESSHHWWWSLRAVGTMFSCGADPSIAAPVPVQCI